MIAMNDLYLIYVGSVGEIGEANVCDFYFSRNPDDAIGDGWAMSARDNVAPPDPEWNDKHFRLIAPGLELSLLEEDYQLCYLDGVYGVIALAWETVDYLNLSVADLATLNERMLRFFYGETLESVLKRLQARGFALELLAEADPAATGAEDDEEVEAEQDSYEDEEEDDEGEAFNNLPF